LTLVPSEAMTRTGTRAGRREWIGLAVLTLPALLASMDLSVLFMAAPWLAADSPPLARSFCGSWMPTAS